MKIVINCCWGGFSIPEPLWDVIVDQYDASTRLNPILIEWVEQNPGKSDLGIAEIPENATDWEISDYDGVEHIIAVVDGKLIHIRANR